VSDISQIVAPLALQADEQAEWPPLWLRVRTYLTSRLPPLDLVSWVRALVRQGDQILVVRDPLSSHILPGGRREPGETLLQTLEREILEETGWTIRNARLLGLAHVQHLTPKPADYRYPTITGAMSKRRRPHAAGHQPQLAVNHTGQGQRGQKQWHHDQRVAGTVIVWREQQDRQMPDTMEQPAEQQRSSPPYHG
jgi:NUDIX domain